MNHASFALDELPVPMVYATHRTIKDCNSQFAELFGFEQDELRDSSFHILYPDFAGFVRTGKMWQTNMSGDQTYYDERIMLKRDKTQFWCKVRGRTRLPVDPFAEAIYCFEPIQRPAKTNNASLTDRQLQILALVAQGKTSAAIGEEVGLSARTVEAHRARIMKAVGVRNSAELIAWFQPSQPDTPLP